MSIGGSIKHAFHHAAHEAEHAAKDAADKVGHEAKHDADKVESAADTVADQLKRIAEAGDDQVARLTDVNVALLKKAGEDIEKDLEAFEKKAVRELTSAAVHRGLEEADKVLKRIDHALEHYADTHPALVAALNAVGDDIVLGPILLHYASFYSRAADITAALDKTLGGDFKLTQAFLNELIRGLGPDAITIDAEIDFFSRFGIDLDGTSAWSFSSSSRTIFSARWECRNEQATFRDRHPVGGVHHRAGRREPLPAGQAVPGRGHRRGPGRHARHPRERGGVLLQGVTA